MRPYVLFVLALCSVFAACEIPGDAAPIPDKPTTDEKSVADSGPSAVEAAEAARRAAERAAAERAAAERRAAEEAERLAAEARRRADAAKGRQYDMESVDGRVSPPLRAKAAAPAVKGMVEYVDPGAPAPVRPQNGKVVVARRAAPSAMPAVRNEPYTSVVVEAADGDAEWEAALLRRGGAVLDRTMLSQFERELYLQEATVSEQDATRLPRKDPAMLPDLSVVGRDAFARLASVYWIRVGGASFFPVVSGRAVPAPDRLPVGVAESATAILRVDEAAAQSASVELVVDKPVAKSVPYVPQFGDAAKVVADAATWSRDAKDPWLQTCKGGLVYFDATARALWRLDRAWLGGPVTREAYVNARLRDASPLCAACRRPLPGKAKVVTPDEKAAPTLWWCRECEQSKEVAYFDGYGLSGASHAHDHAVVEWRWVEPTPGLHPVLTPPAGRGVGHAFELGGATNWKHGDLAASLTPEMLLSDAAQIRWCWVRPDGSAVVFDEKEWLTLLEAADGGNQPLRMPVCEASGAQAYALEREPTVRTTVAIPVEAVALPVRMALTASTRLVVAGRFAIDYRNLLDADVEIEVGVDGPDLSKWPSVGEQRAALRKRLQQMLADTVVK